MKFTIDRKIWLRGEGCSVSRLLRSSDGKMCCIGQVCEQLGINKEKMKDINGVGTLSQLCGFPKILENILVDSDYYKPLSFVSRCYLHNDCPFLSSSEREKAIAEEFSTWGHQIEFIN